MATIEYAPMAPVKTGTMTRNEIGSNMSARPQYVGNLHETDAEHSHLDDFQSVRNRTVKKDPADHIAVHE
ncbi:MAG: hypothetical protein ABF303_07360 [Desulfobacterales bacterium]